MKILIVDDLKENRYLVETMLKASGYEVVSAANGAEALEKLHADAFDMIISDILMPVMDGFQLCRKVKGDEKLKGIPFVFYTATYIDEKDEEFALKLGADKFIRKPVEPDEFIKIMQGVSKNLKKGEIRPKKPVLEEEKEIVKLYSERLVKKLEKKMLDLEREVTERKQVEEALQESETRFQTLFEGIPDPVLIHDDEGTILYINEIGAEQLEWSAKDLIGRNLREIVTPEQRLLIADHIKETHKIGWCRFETTYVSRSGWKIIAEVHDRPIKFGKEKAILRVSRDITERKQVEKELRDSYQKSHEMLVSTVHALASTVEMKDQYTAGHQPRVSQLVCAIAKEMGLSQEQIEGVRMAASIHDIGKIMVPAEILNKPGPLTEIQYEMIKMHPRAGYDILKGIEFPWPVAQIILQHHELMDGSGYPQGLSGDEIMVEARILTVANVVEAMTSHRPYRAAYDIEEALAEISKNKGILYGPEVVDACVRLFAEKGFKLE